MLPKFPSTIAIKLFLKSKFKNSLIKAALQIPVKGNGIKTNKNSIKYLKFLFFKFLLLFSIIIFTLSIIFLHTLNLYKILQTPLKNTNKNSVKKMLAKKQVSIAKNGLITFSFSKVSLIAKEKAIRLSVMGRRAKINTASQIKFTKFSAKKLEILSILIYIHVVLKI